MSLSLYRLFPSLPRVINAYNLPQLNPHLPQEMKTEFRIAVDVRIPIYVKCILNTDVALLKQHRIQLKKILNDIPFLFRLG